MKKTLLLTIIIAASIGISQANVLEGRFGYFNPVGVTGNGNIIFGASYGKGIDQMVNVSLGFDYFGKTFEEKVTVDTDTTIIGTTMTKVLYRHTVRYLPLFASISLAFPIDFAIKPYAGLDLGYGLGSVSYSYNDTLASSTIDAGPDDGWYSGFGWRVRAGGKIKLGYNSAFVIQAMYNGNTISREEESGYKRELDMAGLGFGAALELSGF
ncbi:MAG: hypothetical protein Q8O74_05320 [bacterium]|nr:hypothetical protein [bacterium]